MRIVSWQLIVIMWCYFLHFISPLIFIVFQALDGRLIRVLGESLGLDPSIADGLQRGPGTIDGSLIAWPSDRAEDHNERSVLPDPDWIYADGKGNELLQAIARISDKDQFELKEWPRFRLLRLLLEHQNALKSLEMDVVEACDGSFDFGRLDSALSFGSGRKINSSPFREEAVIRSRSSSQTSSAISRVFSHGVALGPTIGVSDDEGSDNCLDDGKEAIYLPQPEDWARFGLNNLYYHGQIIQLLSLLALSENQRLAGPGNPEKDAAKHDKGRIKTSTTLKGLLDSSKVIYTLQNAQHLLVKLPYLQYLTAVSSRNALSYEYSIAIYLPTHVGIQ